MTGLYRGVNSVELEPTEFSIGQNYPNPFSEKTVIKYCVAYKTRVQIAVYKTEGEEIKKLVDEEKNPGTYEVEFSACHFCESGKLDQGYYFYRMRAGDFTSEKKWLCINKLSGRLNMKNLLQTLIFFLLVTQICFAQWVQVGLGDKAIKDIATRNSNIFAITFDSGSVYRSTDNGNNWTVIVDTSAADIAIAPSGTIFLLKKIIFYGVLWNRLFSSPDNGAMWDTINVEEQIIPPGWEPPQLMNVSVSHTGIVYCGISKRTGEKGGCTFIAYSTDGGITWATPGWDLLGGHLFDYKGERVISAGFCWGLDAPRSGDDHLYMSTDDGSSWTELGNPPLFVGGCHVLSLCLNGNILLGGSDYLSSGLFLTTDSCTTWLQVSTVIPKAGLSIESGGTLVGTDSLGIFFFSDNGDSLGARNDGLTNLNIHTLSIDNNDYVYAGTDSGIWKRPLSEIVTSIKEISTTIPTKFLLSQNYPNPFNPTTSIQYAISSRQFVKLIVYDVLGNEIETLVREEKPAGTYEVTWYTVNLPSGVYFYRLNAENFIETKKMLLLK
jgi:hypothetical protein